MKTLLTTLLVCLLSISAYTQSKDIILNYRFYDDVSSVKAFRIPLSQKTTNTWSLQLIYDTKGESGTLDATAKVQVSNDAVNWNDYDKKFNVTIDTTGSQIFEDDRFAFDFMRVLLTKNNNDSTFLSIKLNYKTIQ